MPITSLDPSKHTNKLPQILKENNVKSLKEDITFFIRKDGLDTNSGLTEKKAWRTIEYAYHFIRTKIIQNKYKVYLDIESGAYNLDEFSQTILLSSPATIDENKYIVLGTEEFKSEAKLNESVDEINKELKRLEKKVNKADSNVQFNQASTSHEIERIEKKADNAVTRIEQNVIKRVNNIIQEVDTRELKVGQKLLAENVDHMFDDLLELNNLVGTLRSRLEALSQSSSITVNQIRSILNSIEEIELHAKIQQDAAELLTDVVTSAQDDIRDLNKKYEKQQKKVVNCQAKIQDLYAKVDNNQLRVEKRFESLIEHIKEHLEDIANPHNVTADQIVFDEHSLTDVLTEIYKLINNLYGINISDPVTVQDAHLRGQLVLNGLKTNFIYENCIFFGDNAADFSLVITGGSNVTLRNCQIRSSKAGCIHVSSNATLTIEGDLEIPDRVINIISKSTLNAVVNANGVNIIPNATKASFGTLAFASGGSVQDWTNYTVEGEFKCANLQKEIKGGNVLLDGES